MRDRQRLPRFRMKYRLVLWDFDGTLADTLALALHVYNQLAKEQKFQPITDPAAVRDMSMREFLRTHGVPRYRVPFAFAAFLKRIRSQAASVSLHDGITDVVQQLFELGLQQGVVSSNSTENINSCLQASSVMSCFAFVGGTSRVSGKETRIRKVVRELGMPPADVLYVGDEIRDINAARSAGVDIASVTWGLNSAAALSRHDPTWLISEPAELLRVVQS